MAINVLGIFNFHKQGWAGQTEDFYSKHWTERRLFSSDVIAYQIVWQGNCAFLLVGTPQHYFKYPKERYPQIKKNIKWVMIIIIR